MKLAVPLLPSEVPVWPVLATTFTSLDSKSSDLIFFSAMLVKTTFLSLVTQTPCAVPQVGEPFFAIVFGKTPFGRSKFGNCVDKVTL